MVRRVVLTVAWSLAGYMLGVMVSFTVVSLVLTSKVNATTANKATRDRWAFILAVVGLVLGGVLGWWRAGQEPPDAR